jgi:hypothetical protein
MKLLKHTKSNYLFNYTHNNKIYLEKRKNVELNQNRTLVLLKSDFELATFQTENVANHVVEENFFRF